MHAIDILPDLSSRRIGADLPDYRRRGPVGDPYFAHILAYSISAKNEMLNYC